MEGLKTLSGTPCQNIKDILLQKVDQLKQFIETHITCGEVTTTTAEPLLLDLYPGAEFAYSVRKLRNDYIGYCMKVRRSSDNATQDIGFVNNVLDESSLLSFIGSNSGFVETWYDQSENGIDLTQSTTTKQVSIAVSGTLNEENSRPALVNDKTANKHMNNSVNVSQPTTYFMVGKSIVSDQHFLDGDVYRNLIGCSSGLLMIYAGAVLNHGAKQTTQQLIYALFNGTNSAVATNGGTAITGNAGTYGLQTAILFAGNGDDPINGLIQEFICYGSNQSSNRSDIETNINNFYSIY